MKKFILEAHNPNNSHGWGWTGLQSDSLDELMEAGKAHAAKHHMDRVRSLTTFRIVESNAPRNQTTGQYNADVVPAAKVWEVA